jgi:hypothetical protein
VGEASFRKNISKSYFNLKGKNAEKLVHDLALKTFLTDWCYLNPKRPTGKELCDLLVVFDEVAIIWQIKDLKLDNQGKYKESEVRKNLRQLSGARRQLFELATPIELENPRRGKERFDLTAIKEVYLISVLLGEGEEVFSFAEYVKNRTIHIFTREFTQIILDELDTIGDFTNYIRAKEALLGQNKKFIILGGEEELLAFYLLNNRSFERLNEATDIFIDQGSWEHFHNSQEYKEKKKQDEISYGWDDIINRVHEASPGYEKVARELTRPNRFERRCLSKTYFEAYVMADIDNKYPLFRRTFAQSGVTYCFLFADDTKPREYRKGMLSWMCYIARGTYKENRKVLGIATEKKASPTCSYDFVLLDMPDWTEENQKEMEKVQQETGILLNPVISIAHEDEYPKLAKD